MKLVRIPRAEIPGELSDFYSFLSHKQRVAYMNVDLFTNSQRIRTQAVESLGVLEALALEDGLFVHEQHLESSVPAPEHVESHFMINYGGRTVAKGQYRTENGLLVGLDIAGLDTNFRREPYSLVRTPSEDATSDDIFK